MESLTGTIDKNSVRPRISYVTLDGDLRPAVGALEALTEVRLVESRYNGHELVIYSLEPIPVLQEAVDKLFEKVFNITPVYA